LDPLDAFALLSQALHPPTPSLHLSRFVSGQTETGWVLPVALSWVGPSAPRGFAEGGRRESGWKTISKAWNLWPMKMKWK